MKPEKTIDPMARWRSPETFDERLRLVLGVNQLNDFERDYLTDRNISSGFTLAFVTILLEAWMIKNSFEMGSIPAVVEKVGWTWIIQHRISYFIMAGSAALFMAYVLLIRICGGGTRFWKNVFITQFMAVVLGCGIYFAMADLTRGNGIASLMTEVVALACVFYVRPLIMFAALGGSFAWLMHIAEAMGQMSHGAQINNVFLLIILMIACDSRYTAAVGAARATWEALQLSLHDNLTGVSNMRALTRDFETIFTGKPVTVALIDIDDFKRCNDTLGHDVGDRLLARFGELIRMLADPDEHCYRYGGDEFVAVGPLVADERIQEKFEDLQRKLAEVDEVSVGAGVPVGSYGTQLLSCTMGYATGTPQSMKELRSMIRLADENMYKAKNSGKSRCAGSAWEPEA